MLHPRRKTSGKFMQKFRQAYIGSERIYLYDCNNVNRFFDTHRLLSIRKVYEYFIHLNLSYGY